MPYRFVSRHLRMVPAFAVLVLLATAVPARSSIIAYDNPVTTGNQQWGGSLGMDFDVLSPINITALGVFDSGLDGLQTSISVAIYDRNTATMVTPLLVFSGTGDPGDYVINGSRFRSIAPVALGPGSYSIVAWGYGSSEPNGNSGVSQISNSTMNDGGGLISFVGDSRYANSPGVYPTNVDSGPANRYLAGTFVYDAYSEITTDSVVPEPSTVLFMAAGLGVCACVRRRRAN